jgi:hypothetical protein
MRRQGLLPLNFPLVREKAQRAQNLSPVEEDDDDASD